MSWLNSQTGDADHIVSPLIAEISRLQYELDVANESIDDKLDKLEDAGLGVVGLTQKLEDARARIVALEDEIARLTRKEERRMRYLEKARCRKCLTKFNLGLSEGNDRCVTGQKCAHSLSDCFPQLVGNISSQSCFRTANTPHKDKRGSSC